MPKPSLKPDDPAQSKRFVEMATELGATGNPADFERAFHKVATAKRVKPPTPRKKRAKS